MKLNVNYSPKVDVENYFHAIFDQPDNSYGREGMREKMLMLVEFPKLKEILSSGEERSAIFERSLEFLSGSDNIAVLEEKSQKLLNSWDKLGNQIIFQLEAFYDYKWPFDEIHVELTTIPFCPYDFQKRKIFIHGSVGVQTQLRVLAHELNHFMFYWLYEKDLLPKLGREKFEILKESMTIFTNPEQAPKPAEEELRRVYMEKGAKNINEAVVLALEHWGV